MPWPASADAGAVDAAGAGFVGRQQAISAAIAHQRHAGHPQRVFEHIERVGLRHRANRGQRHGSLHARIDGVADANTSPRMTFATVATGAFSKLRS